jgi:hypothetical protein
MTSYIQAPRFVLLTLCQQKQAERVKRLKGKSTRQGNRNNPTSLRVLDAAWWIFENRPHWGNLLVMIFLLASFPSNAGGSIQFLEPYSVEGLAVGAPVDRSSKAYKRYKCKSSEQYKESIACKLTQSAKGETKIITILHMENDIVTYINKAVFPAFFTVNDINSELSRLSKRFNGAPEILKTDEGIIAKWGSIELVPLSKNDLIELAQDRNPNLGYLVDFKMNFHDSARSSLPVYRLSGGKGFLWIARFQTNEREGTLRFLAADPSQMRHAFTQPSSHGDDRTTPGPASIPDRRSNDPACEKYPDLC